MKNTQLMALLQDLSYHQAEADHLFACGADAELVRFHEDKVVNLKMELEQAQADSEDYQEAL